MVGQQQAYYCHCWTLFVHYDHKTTKLIEKTTLAAIGHSFQSIQAHSWIVYHIIQFGGGEKITFLTFLLSLCLFVEMRLLLRSEAMHQVMMDIVIGAAQCCAAPWPRPRAISSGDLIILIRLNWEFPCLRNICIQAGRNCLHRHINNTQDSAGIVDVNIHCRLRNVARQSHSLVVWPRSTFHFPPPLVLEPWHRRVHWPGPVSICPLTLAHPLPSPAPLPAHFKHEHTFYINR